MKHNLQKGGVLLCFILTTNITAGAQTPTPTGVVAYLADNTPLLAVASTRGENHTSLYFTSNRTAKSPDADLKDADAGEFDTPFVRCNNNLNEVSYKIKVKNNSATRASNKSYRISWGDNVTEEYDNSFDVASHTYTKLGTFEMVLTVTGTDGSTSSKTFKVFNGRTPNLTMGSPDHTGGCAPQTYVFPIGGITNNPPNTLYTFTFDDGTPPLVYTQENVPSSITHIFDKSSCSRPGDTFTLTGRAENPCGSTEVKVLSRKIGAKPKVGFNVSKETTCTESDVHFKNTTQNGNSITNSGDCSPASTFSWKIEPASGWTITSGTNTSKDIAVRFSQTGTYKVSLVSSNDCGADEITKVVTVMHPPQASFSVDRTTACKALTVATTNNSAGENLSYSWSVTPNSGYTLQSGSLNSANPIFQFTKAGSYAITLTASTSCGSKTATQEVTVKEAPLITLPAAKTYCGPQSIKFDAANSAHAPVINSNNGTLSSYTWSVSGGATFVPPSNRNSQFPEINFPKKGTYTVSLTAANECGEPVAATQTITIDELNNNTLGSGLQVCYGQPVSITSGTTTTGGNGTYTYLWESSTTSATSGFAPATGTNTSPTYTAEALHQTTWFRRKVSVGTCAPDISNAVQVTVLPAITDNALTGEQIVCGNNPPSRITGPEPTGGLGRGTFTYTWEYSTTDATTGFAPVTDATEREYLPKAFAPVTWFRRVARSGGCETTSQAVQVTFLPLPDLPEIRVPEVCAGSSAKLAVTNLTAGTCDWFGDETSTTPLHTGDSFTTPALQATTTYYVRYTNPTGCASPRTKVTVTVYPLTTVNTISSSQLLCTGEKPVGLTGSTPTGGNGTYSYKWEQSSDDVTYTAASGINNTKDYQPPMLTQDTWYRRRVVSNSCEHISDPVKIAVNRPLSNNSISGNLAICAGAKPATIKGSIPTGGGSNFSYLWEYSTTSGTTGFAPAPGHNNGADYLPGNLVQATWFRRKVTSPPCQESMSEAVLINVEPQPEAPLAKGSTICPGERATLTATALLKGYTLEWYSHAQGGIPLHTGETFTTPPLVATTRFYVQALNPLGCPSKRQEVTVAVAEPHINAGQDATIMAERGAQLKASGGKTYSWSPASSLSNPNIPAPVATPEATTTYTVTVTTSEGCTATDEVTVTVLPKIHIPNAITVNGDGMNDTWYISNIDKYPNCHIQIFTRWGAKIFESVGYKTPWDGTHQGSELPMSAYYFIIKLDKNEDAITGSITLIK